jgi:hypothetical protein
MSKHNGDDLAIGCQCGCNAPDPTGLRNLGTALLVARLSAYKVTAPGVMDIIAALNDLIAGVEELQRQ